MMVRTQSQPSRPRPLTAFTATCVPAGSAGLTYLCSNVMEGRLWRHGPPSLVGIDVLQPERTGLGAIFRAAGLAVAAARADLAGVPRALHIHPAE